MRTMVTFAIKVARQAGCSCMRWGDGRGETGEKEASSTEDDRGGGEIQKVTFFGSLCLFKRMKNFVESTMIGYPLLRLNKKRLL